MKLKKALWLAAGLGLLAMLLANAAAAAAACRDALAVCGKLLIPSLFPFFVLSGMLNRLGLPGTLGKLLAPFAVRLYGISGAGASALLIGLTGGYPAGAAYIAEMERSGAVTTAEAERLLAFCNNTGPAFLVGAVGIGVFGSVRIGMLLYAIHVLSALTTGLFFRGGHPCLETQPLQLESADPASALTESVRQAVTSILSVCGFAVFFQVLLAVLDAGGTLTLLCARLGGHLGWEAGFVRSMLAGLIELAGGTVAMQGLPLCPESLALAAFLAGWGGLSVQFQTLAVLAESRVKGALHPAGRRSGACISAALACAAGILLL